MAEEERMWLQRHAHESSTISYGQFGTPVYHESSQEWEFSRKDDFTEVPDESATEQEDSRGQLNILTGPEIVIQPASINVSDLETRKAFPQVKEFPHAAAASSFVKAVDKERAAGVPSSHQGSRIAFGSALWLSADGVDSGNLVVPIVAYVTGLGADTLCLACLGQERLQYSTKDDFTVDVRVPSLTGEPQVFWPGIEPILQLSFSQRSDEGHGDTFLLVRRASQTSVFEPLLHRGGHSHIPSQTSSSLDPNLLVTLHASVTGGCRHVDSAFHPSDHRRIAIVDEEGNWSIWKIRGRRSTTARVLYQARLRASGKVFSWKYRKRPEGVGLFFDGWHRVVWTSSDGHEVDRILVCNRQTIKVFTLAGQELRSIDPRLDLGKASFILDIRSGPRINLCLILTTSKLLMFDMGQQEWKDPASGKGPALLCAFQHFQNPAGLSLKTANFQFEDEVLLALYSTDLHSLRMLQLTFSEVDGKASVVVSDTWSLDLPLQSLGTLAAVILAPSEVAHTGGNLPRFQEELLRIIIQYEDLSVYSLWATVRALTVSRKSAAKRHLLRLPPNRSLQRKSGLRVDDADDEDDVDDFILSDVDEQDEVLDVNNVLPQSGSPTAFRKVKVMKHVDEIHDAIKERHANDISKSTIEASKRLESRLQDLTLSDDTTPGCLPLSELIEDGARTGDVEAESDMLQQTVSNVDQHTTDWAISLCHGKSAETLVSAYNSMFDTFVESLPSSLPDRSRVQKERQYRSVALEQYLSGRIIRRIARETKSLPDKTKAAASDASQLVFSDPLQHNDPESQHFQAISASQPLPQTRSASSSSSAVPSLLLDSLSRLQSYTKVTYDLEEILTDNPDSLEHLSSVLSHLPNSCEENPEDYDYHGRVMANAAKTAETHAPDMQSGGRAQRKGARLNRAMKRAEELRSGIHSGKQNSHSKTADKELGNISRAVNFSGQQSQDRNAGILPIRTSGERFPELAWRDKVAQTQDGYHLSDGHVPAESSSQAATRENVTLTQPERGAFANRSEIKGQDKAKKKKKRIAGF